MSAATTASAPQLTVAPRLQILANGQSILASSASGQTTVAPLSATVTSTNYAAGDTFSAEIAYDTSSPVPAWADPPAGTTEVEATIQFATAAASGQPAWQTMIVGLIDKVSIDPFQGVIRISGRDYSSRLIDLRVQEGWLNQRSGEVVTQLAQQVGLTPNVVTQGGLTGQYYQIAHRRSALAAGHRFTTGWEVVRFLAAAEGCDVWVSGTTLNFVPQLSNDAPAFPVAVTRDANGRPIFVGTTLSLERNLTYAKGVVVQVLSWESKSRTATSAFWSSKGAVASGSTAAAQAGQLFVFKEPGLTKDQAGARANQLYDQIIAHQRTATIEVPIEFALTPRQSVLITGTNTTYDGRQRIDSITRTLSWNDASETIVVRNRDVTEDAGQ